MSSPPKEVSKEAKEELKAGHPPAVKVGGVRITQHKPEKKEEAAAAPLTKEEAEEFPEPKPNPNDEHKVIISGAVVKGDKDFPPEAVKSYHEKPVPVHEKPAHNYQNQHHQINQPRKQ